MCMKWPLCVLLCFCVCVCGVKGGCDALYSRACVGSLWFAMCLGCSSFHSVALGSALLQGYAGLWVVAAVLRWEVSLQSALLQGLSQLGVQYQRHKKPRVKRSPSIRCQSEPETSERLKLNSTAARRCGLS